MGLGAAIAGGAAGLIGGILQNRANAKEADKARTLQLGMSNSAHQREVADLRKAGLNPILSAGGQGASSGPTPMAQMEDAIGKGISSALEARRLKKEIEGQDAANNLAKAQETAAKAAAIKETNSAKNIDIQTKALSHQLEAIAKRAKVDAKEAEYDEKTLPGRYMNKMIQEGLGTLNSGKDLLLKIPNGKEDPDAWKKKQDPKHRLKLF